MSSIKKDKNGLWTVRYDAGFDGQGKRKQKYKGGFVKKGDAETYLTGIENSINKNMYIEPDKVFLFEYLNRWLEYEKEWLSPTTYSGYEVNIRCHINPIIGGMRLQELKSIYIKDLYSKLQKNRKLTIDGKSRHFKPLSPKSILYVHRVLSKALEDAYKDELISRNPAKSVTPPKVPKHKAKFLTTEQIKIMLERFRNDEMYMPVYLSVVLGLRRGEALGLEWKHIDLENKIVMVRYNYTMFNGKPILLEKLKTEDSERDIIITDRIVKILKEHRKRQLELKLSLGDKYYKSDFVCTWSDGKPFNPSHISRAFKLRMQKYGLPGIRFHDLRHSNGALMIAQNVPLKAASDRLGHSTIVITNDFYGHVEKSVHEHIAQTIDRAIWGE